uniref:Uncharacterized protein n=1 Tax=Strombidinopsis acuminata TaxID=141414 RepID=A0A7S3TR87_9SPIT|mmetsp:Transcript_73327/g.101738  ORF Transcript_73327/g.101738 Transcript_73327/m.101738 type:complete len:719 (+) Transcript_73327:91-2247(+)
MRGGRGSTPPVLLALLVAGAGAAGGRVTPVAKVTELLEKLKSQVVSEGHTEAVQYDKYSCFCKEQADNKQYAIEKSTEKIEALTAEIDKLAGEITTLDGEIGGLSTKITNLGATIVSLEGARATEHDTYKVNEADASKAISQIQGALEALKASKGKMAGKTDMEIALPQIRAVAVLAMSTAASSNSALTDAQWKILGDLASKKQPGKSYEYEYHSNDIIALLEKLHTQFQQTKLELDQDEFDANSAFEKERLALQNLKKFAEKEKAEKEAVREAKTEKKEAAEEDRTQETNEKNADISFRDVLAADCESKAGLWDQRSLTRANELQAIGEAIHALESGVAPNWQANRKLVGLQKKAQVVSAAPRGHWVYVEDQSPAHAKADKVPSFLQLRGSRHGDAAQQTAKAQAFLLQAAKKLNSPVLSAMALKVQTSEDHFVKVRSIIKDLVQRLEDQAQAEATQKSYCDVQMAAATNKRDSSKELEEAKVAAITSEEADKKILEGEIAVLSKEIAELKKALLEATELRQEEKADNTKVINDAGAGKEAVEYALQVLKAFYEGAAFVQYVPPNSDRAGKTVGDYAPEVFDSEYKGSQDASKGILGMLEVILSDFDRTDQTVTDEEEAADQQFTAFETANLQDTDTKEKAVSAKRGEIKDIEDDLVTLTDEKAAAVKAYEGALAELASLHSMCVQGEETHEERAAKRKKEIEALKEAHGILENWQA